MSETYLCVRTCPKCSTIKDYGSCEHDGVQVDCELVELKYAIWTAEAQVKLFEYKLEEARRNLFHWQTVQKSLDAVSAEVVEPLKPVVAKGREWI